MTKNKGHDLKKAFTLLELVFVIVVIGILAAVIIPRTKTNNNAEAATKLISMIRYTQHLAIVNDKYNAKDINWYKKRWQIMFTGHTYSIMSNGVYAKDPQTKKDINAVDLKIDSIILSGGCQDQNAIYFDYLGRPFTGNTITTSTPYQIGNLIKTNCIITLKNTGEIDEVLKLFPETGYIKR